MAGVARPSTWKFHPSDIGSGIEDAVENICTELGFVVERPKAKTLAFDMVVNGFRVQVKARKKAKYRGQGGWHIHLCPNKGKYVYAVSQIDFFVLRHDVKWFVFPSGEIAEKDGNIKNSLDVRRVFDFEDSWHLLSGCGGVRRGQLELF